MAEPATYSLRLADGTEYGPAEIDLVTQWAREGRVPTDALLVAHGGGPARPVLDVPGLGAILRAPPVVAPAAPVRAGDAPLAGLIPYRNPAALVGYYLGVFSVIPLLGLVLGPAAVICGIFGLRKGLRQPSSKGVVHAWVAIILGFITTIAYWMILIALVLSM